MEKETIQISKTIYKEKCPYCDKEITGTKDTQVLANLDTHIRFAHPEKKK